MKALAVRAFLFILFVAPVYADVSVRENVLTNRLIVQSLPYARLVDAGYKFQIEEVPGFRRLEKEQLPSEWQNLFIPHKSDPKYPLGKGMLINDKKHGMWATVLESLNGRQVVVVLRGTELRPSHFGDMVKNFWTVAKQWVGKGIPDHFKRAFELARDVKEMYPNKELVVVGSSLGGSLAMFAGLALNARVYAFNSLGLNEKEVAFAEQHNRYALLNARFRVTILNVVGDSVGGTSMLPSPLVNKYYGTLVKVPFYDQSWSGTLFSVHHTSDAIVKSIEKYVDAH